jgi:cobyrinic acid a,c-diamide synthase
VEQRTFQAVKGERSWDCYAQYRNVTAGFPHLHYAANPKFAQHFCEKCRAYHAEKRERTGESGKK